MSVNLWRLFIEDDVDGFRQFLANATLSSGPQRTITGGGCGSATSKIGSPGGLATSPKAHLQNRKPSGISSGNARGVTTLLTRSDINARDTFGRTLLHHAASSVSPTSIEFVLALLEVPFVDLYIQDAESGWTALHRALYFGNISVAQALMLRDVKDATDYTTIASHAHAGGLVKIKDHEGNSPFEVFSLTIASRTLQTTRPRLSISSGDEDSGNSVNFNEDENSEKKLRRVVQPLVDLRGDEVFAFGSNKNHSLGLGDEDDRHYPERLTFVRPKPLLHRLLEEHQASRETARQDDLSNSSFFAPDSNGLPAIIQNAPLGIQDVFMSKMHTAVLTNDPVSNLFVSGFGRGGRLGTGDENTRFSFVCVQGGGLAKRKVVAMALGHYHSIAIDSHGEVFTWGSNRYGQLGYALPETSAKEEPVQLVPRQLYGHVKKELVIGAAASSIHSAIFTSTALYTFGKNEGQLGLMDADARSLECQTIPRRMGVSILQSSIEAVSAIDRATSVLLENHDLIVFTHFGWTKIIFQLDGFVNYFVESVAKRVAVERNSICKVTSGGNTICALSTFGEVYTIDVTAKIDLTTPKASTTNPSKARNALPAPTRVWSIKKAHMSATDVAVGQDGSIILCTQAGSVWRKEKRAKIKALGKDTTSSRTKDYKFARIANLARAVAIRSNAYGSFMAVRRDCDAVRTQIIVNPPEIWDSLFSLLPFCDYRHAKDSTQDRLEPQLRFWAPSSKPDSPAKIKSSILSSLDIESDLQAYLARYEPLSGSQYDVWISSNVTDLRIPAHSFLLKARSIVLRRALTEFDGSYYSSIGDILSIQYGTDGQAHLQFQGADPLTIINFVFYLYTENVVDFWHYAQNVLDKAPRYRQIRTEIMKIATNLEMRQLEKAVRVMIEPIRSLHWDMERAFADEDFFSDADLLIELADGAVLPAHSVLLCARCPFFNGLFHGRAAGRWMSSRRDTAQIVDEAIKVDLKHFDCQTFRIVLRHIYADTGEELFENVVSGDLDEFLDLVIDVMSIANELMLDRLAQVCQKILGKYVNVRNVCQLLNIVAACSVNEFKHAGLEYCALNLESMLELRLLEELEVDLLTELDEVVQQNQLASQPYARSGRAQANLIEHYPDLIGQIHQCRQRRVDSMRLRSRFAGDDERPSSGHKPMTRTPTKVLSSPQIQPAESSSSQERNFSPLLVAKDGNHDLLFQMDDENVLGSPLTGSGVASDNLHSQLPTSPSLFQSSPPESDGWYDSRGKSLAGSAATDLSTSSTSFRKKETSSSTRKTPTGAVNDTLPEITTQGFFNTQTVWNTPGPSSQRAERAVLKDIIAQASRSSVPQTSNLTQAMKLQSESFKTPAKMSQRERKRMMQQSKTQEDESWQNDQGSSLQSPGSVPSVSKSPWKVLRSVSGSTAPVNKSAAQPSSLQPPLQMPARPMMTMRQTVAGITPNAQDRVKGPEIEPSRALTTSKSGPLQVQSIRHTPNRSAKSEMRTQSSMVEILAQQQTEKTAIKEAVAKRSLQEIQQEQEFQQWWENESRKVQEEAEASAASSRRGRRGRGGENGRWSGRGSTTQISKHEQGESLSIAEIQPQLTASSSRGRGRGRGRAGSGRGVGKEKSG